MNGGEKGCDDKGWKEEPSEYRSRHGFPFPEVLSRKKWIYWEQTNPKLQDLF